MISFTFHALILTHLPLSPLKVDVSDSPNVYNFHTYTNSVLFLECQCSSVCHYICSCSLLLSRSPSLSPSRRWQCWLEVPGACPPGSSHTFWLLPGYCLVNFVFNMLGLFLTSEGGASLNAISYSMLLPLTTLSNSLPLLGKFRENLQVTA